MNEMRELKDLAIGDVIQIEGFDDNMVVRSAKKIKRGLDAGKLEVALTAPDGEREVMAFAPEERAKVVGKDAEGGKGKGGGKAKGKGKGKAKAKAKAESETAPLPRQMPLRPMPRRSPAARRRPRARRS